MYYRNPDYYGLERRLKAAGVEPNPKPQTLLERLLTSTGAVLIPVFAIFLAIGIGLLVG